MIVASILPFAVQAIFSLHNSAVLLVETREF